MHIPRLSIPLLLLLVAAAPADPATLLKNAATQPTTQEWPGEYNDTPTTGEADSLAEVVQLTTGSARAGECYFSPDMRWIIFQSAAKKEDQYQMFVAKLKRDGDRIMGAEKPTQISREPSRNTCGYFSPDGNTLLFGSTFGKEKPDEPSGGYQRQGGNYRWAFPDGMEIFICNHWKDAVEKAGPGAKAELDLVRLTDNNVYDAECDFSPDGKWICFASNQNNNLDIYVMKLQGGLKLPEAPAGQHPFMPARIEPAGPPVRITTAEGYDGGPFFSPDGKRLLYRSDRQKNDLLQVFTCDLAFDADGNITGAKAEHQLTRDVNVNWGPSFHPDGHHIIYATSKHGHTNYELYLMRDDGTHKTRITYSPGADILPVFSPDGKYLMWTSKRAADQTSQVFIARFKFPVGS